MSDEIRACIDRFVPEEDSVKAFELAVEENPDNKPAWAEGADDQELALVAGKKWSNGRTLKVGFLDGDADVQAKIEPLAHIWSEFANIKFDFGNHAHPEIRISFKERGSWSYLGTDALTISAHRPTMNYGWLKPSSSDEEYERVVVHEFGHALGCIHEHQNPGANIPWDTEKVYAYYMGPPNNWPKAQVFHNLLRRYSAMITQFSEFDKESIMLYPIPNQHTIGDYEVGWNRKLSKRDMEFIGRTYPK